MSYDLEILAKIENGDYICIAEPKYSSPTYNLGKMFRVAYGVFVVTKDVYEKVKVGDEVMM